MSRPEIVKTTSNKKRQKGTAPNGVAATANSATRVKDVGVDFGTYHHSTPEESEEIRERVGRSFTKLLGGLYPAGARLRILDAGCGLGFLMYVAAQCFPKARILGVDLFKHASIAGMSLDKATSNMRLLGIASRTSFLKHDLTKSLESAGQYDLVISNVVFHNMGKKRLKAYGTVFDVLKRGGFFVIGDLFPQENVDTDYFRGHSRLTNEVEDGGWGRWTYKIKVLRKDKSVH